MAYYVSAVGAAGAAAYSWYRGWATKGQKEEESRYAKECQDLREEIRRPIKDSTGEIITFRFLILGVASHGKSTLCCGWKSALDGDAYISDYFQADSGSASSTSGFCPCDLSDNLWLIDMGGIFESPSFNQHTLQNIMEGKDSALDLPRATSNDITCVVIVMRPDTKMTQALRRKFEVIDACARKGLISRRLVLTHIEDVDPQFKDPRNLVNLEKSQKVRSCKQRMSEETGIPQTSISLVRNYWDRQETDIYTNHVLLKLMQRLVLSGVDAKRRQLATTRLSSS